MFIPVPEPVSGIDPGLHLSPVSFPGEGRAPRAAHAAAGAARPFPAPVGLSMAMHMHVRARVYARGWTSAGRGGNPSAAGLVCRPRSARGDRRAATRARMSLAVLALYSHKPAAVLVCSWRCNCHIEHPCVLGRRCSERRLLQTSDLAPSAECRQGLLVLPLASSRCG